MGMRKVRRCISMQAVAAAAQLRTELVRIFEAMPRDLQQLVLSSPQRADLLYRLRVHSKVRPATWFPQTNHPAPMTEQHRSLLPSREGG